MHLYISVSQSFVQRTTTQVIQLESNRNGTLHSQGALGVHFGSLGQIITFLFPRSLFIQASYLISIYRKYHTLK